MKKIRLIPIAVLSLAALAGCGPKYVAPTYVDDDYSYMLLNDLVGSSGTLSINKDYASVVQGENETKYYMSNDSAMTIIPSESQTSICIWLGMLWLVRMASHPISFIVFI